MQARNMPGSASPTNIEAVNILRRAVQLSGVPLTELIRLSRVPHEALMAAMNGVRPLPQKQLVLICMLTGVSLEEAQRGRRFRE